MALFGLVVPLQEIRRGRSKNIFPPRRQRQSDVVHKDLGFHLDSVSLRRGTVRLPSVNNPSAMLNVQLRNWPLNILSNFSGKFENN